MSRLSTLLVYCVVVKRLQYYATVDAGPVDPAATNIRWLTKENIEDRLSLSDDDYSVLASMLGSGQCVGGVVTQPTEEPGSQVYSTVLLAPSAIRGS